MFTAWWLLATYINEPIIVYVHFYYLFIFIYVYFYYLGKKCIMYILNTGRIYANKRVRKIEAKSEHPIWRRMYIWREITLPTFH